MGIEAPLLVISDRDKAGVLAVVVAFSLCTLLTSLVLRIVTKYRSWKADDWCISTATFLSTVRTSMVFWQISAGLGRSKKLLSEDAQAGLQKAVFAGYFFYFACMMCTKLSVVYLIRYLTKHRKHETFLQVLGGSIVLWAICGCLMVSINCYPAVLSTTQCPNILTRWTVLFVWDVGIEIVLFITAMWYLLEMTVKRKTAGSVILVFAVRLPVIVAASVRLYYLYYSLGGNHDMTMVVIYAAMATSVQIDYGIISSNLLCLKPLVTPYKKSLMYASQAGIAGKTPTLNSGNVLSVQRSMRMEDIPDFSWSDKPA